MHEEIYVPRVSSSDQFQLLDFDPVLFTVSQFFTSLFHCFIYDLLYFFPQALVKFVKKRDKRVQEYKVNRNIYLIYI